MTAKQPHKPTQSQKKKKEGSAAKNKNAKSRAPVTPVSANPAANTQNHQNTEPQKRERGRPRTHDNQVMYDIMDRWMEGESLDAICSEPDMPSLPTFWRRVHKDEELAKEYDLRKKARAPALIERGLEEVTRAHDKDSAYIAATKQRAYFHAAALFDPKNYSDKGIAEASRGGTSGLAININIGTADGHVETVSVTAGDGEDG